VRTASDSAAASSPVTVPASVCQVLRRASVAKDACSDAVRHVALRRGDVVDVFHTADEDLGLVDVLVVAASAAPLGSLLTLPLAALKFDDDSIAASAAAAAGASASPPAGTAAGDKKHSGSRVSRSSKAKDGAPSSKESSLTRSSKGHKDGHKSDAPKRRHSKPKAEGGAAASAAAAGADAPAKKASSRKICEKCKEAPAVAVVEFDGLKLMLCKPCMVSDVARHQQSGEATDIVVVQAKDAAAAAAAAATTTTTAGAAASTAAAPAAPKTAAASTAPAAKAARVCKDCGDSKVAARVKIDGKPELLCKACTIKRQDQFSASAAKPPTVAPAAPKAGSAAPTTPVAKGAATASPPQSPKSEADDASMVAEDAALAALTAAPDWTALDALFQKRTKLGRKVALREVLVWSKKPIEKPLVKLPKLHEKKGEQLALWVHEYITHDGADKTPALTAAQQALTSAIRVGELRDELFALLVRYMHGCDDLRQLWRTWKLWAMSAPIFPASAAMQPFFLGVVSRWTPTPPPGAAAYSLDDRRAFRKYRRWVFEQLKVTGETRSVSARTPPLDELTFYETAPLGPPSLFGCTLARALDIQREHYPQHGTKLPLVVTVCMRLITELDGLKAQGIFRLPGNTDNIKALQLQVNKGDFDLSARPDITVHDIASLLKLWLRGLTEPLIPDSLYAKCIENPDSAKNAMDVYGALPDQNKDLVARLLNFLQTIAYPENQETNKMSLSNLSVVFAPCLLRYPMSADTMTIMANTIKEQAFVLTLLGLPLLNVVDNAAPAAAPADASAPTPTKSAAPPKTPATPATPATPVAAAAAATSPSSAKATLGSSDTKLRRMQSSRHTPSAREAPASTTAASLTDDAIGRSPNGASPLINRLQARMGGGRNSRSASVGSAADAVSLGVSADGGASIAAAAVAAIAAQNAAAAAAASTAAPAVDVKDPPISPRPQEPAPVPEKRKGGSRSEVPSRVDVANDAATAAHKKKTTSLGKVAAAEAAEAAVTRGDRSLKKKAASEAAEAAQARASQALKKKLADPAPIERRSSKSSFKKASDAALEGGSGTLSGSRVQRQSSSSKVAKEVSEVVAAPAVPAQVGVVSMTAGADDDDQSSASSEGLGASDSRKKKGSKKQRSRSGSSGVPKEPIELALADKPPLPSISERPPETPRPPALPDVAPEEPQSDAEDALSHASAASDDQAASLPPALPDDVAVAPPTPDGAAAVVPVGEPVEPVEPAEPAVTAEASEVARVEVPVAAPEPVAVSVAPTEPKDDDDHNDDDDNDDESSGSAISIGDEDSPQQTSRGGIEVIPLSDDDDDDADERDVFVAPQLPAAAIVTMLSDVEDDASDEYSSDDDDSFDSNSGSESPLPPPSD
jgi:hypothetical protein